MTNELKSRIAQMKAEGEIPYVRMLVRLTAGNS